MPLPKYTYETKCRRCGELNLFGGSWTEWASFQESMNMYIQTPRLLGCSACQKKTIQEVVSHTEPPYELLD